MNKKKTYHNDQQSTMGKICRLGKPTINWMCDGQKARKWYAWKWRSDMWNV